MSQCSTCKAGAIYVMDRGMGIIRDQTMTLIGTPSRTVYHEHLLISDQGFRNRQGVGVPDQHLQLGSSHNLRALQSAASCALSQVRPRERRGEEVQSALRVGRSPIGCILVNGTSTYSVSDLRDSQSVR